MVLMTDGQQSYAPDEVDLEDAVAPLVQQDVLRYAIGIGTEISPESLKVIAGKNTVLAENFDALMDKIEEQIGLIGTGGCKGMSIKICYLFFLQSILTKFERQMTVYY